MTFKSLTKMISDPIGEWPAVGTISSDGVAVIGRDGFAFLYGGTNHYYAAYSAQNDDLYLATAWSDYIALAREELAKRGIRFAFALVPNKATLIPDYYPFDLSLGITRRCAFLMDMIEERDRKIFQSFRECAERETIFRRNDSHMTEHGNFILANGILSELEMDLNWNHYNFDTIIPVKHSGDLGYRYEPKADEILKRVRHPTEHAVMTDTTRPSDVKGKFVGQSYEVHNPQAPLAARVLLFGNSFVERMPSWGASMPLAATVKDFKFVWNSRVHFDIVDEWKPDLVVLQSCERFLAQIPTVYA